MVLSLHFWWEEEGEDMVEQERLKRSKQLSHS